MKLYILCLFVICGCIAAQDDDKNSAQDYFDIYDEFYDYDFLKEEGKSIDKKQNESEDSKGEELLPEDYQIKTDKEKVDEKASGESKNIQTAEDGELLPEDYQIEDNKEKIIEKANDENPDSIDSLSKDAEDEQAESTKDKSAETRAKEAQEDYALLWGGDEPAPIPPPLADNGKIFEETQEILNEDDDVNDFDEEKKDISIPVNEQLDLEEIIDETKKLLADAEDDFDLPKISSEKTEDVNSANEEITSQEDTVDKIKQDLDEDLRRLFETMNELSDDGSEEEQNSEEVNPGFVLDYEEKYGKPYHEGLVLSQRDDNDYEEIMDSNLSELFAKIAENSEIIDSGDQEKEELNADDDFKDSPDKKSDDKPNEPIIYQKDALVDETQRVSSDEVEEFNGAPKSTQTSHEALVDSPLESTTEASLRRTKMVDDLSSAELDDLMSQFSMVHSEDLDIHAAGFSKNVAPIHITLNVDEPTVVTSPNYPNNYPTDNIIDWILEGQGMGIEMNITSFAVNGAMGDYVMVKPGGIDDSGHEGLIFTYHLNSEKRYRFGDVDRLFMRFEAKMGMSFTKGFSLSFKMMAPLPIDPEDMPAPEPVLNVPSAVMTVILAGVNAEDFKNIREEFRELVADMATEYIYDNEIDPGMNATIEITQITSRGLCNIHWPGHEQCVTVTFGVPLTYEEDMDYRLNTEDLHKVWKYIQKEDFSKRLELLGVKEFIAPDDGSVLMMWLVIAAGVVISMALLAFALWRFSCFDDYTRMQTFSDTDSIKAHKRDLDLYPTPHQTLPPLYSENDYKWADISKFEDSTRVDMGGFANRSYARDDLYDLEYEEEVPNNDRERNSARDLHSNV